MANISDNNKRIARNSVLMSIRTLFVLFVSLFTTRVVMQVLGIEDFGVYSVVAGFVTLFSFINNSLSGASQRFYNFELGKHGIEGANVIYNASFRVHVVFGIIICCVTEIVGLWYLHNKMVIPVDRITAAVSIFHSCIISLFFTMASVPYSAAIMAHEKMDYYAFTGVLDAILKLAIVYFLTIIDDDKLIVYGWLFCLISIFDFLLYFFYAKKKFAEIVLNFNTPIKSIRSMIAFSLWGALGTMSALVREQGLNLVLNAFFGPIVNAARGIANQVSNALNSFVMSIITPARPQIIQSYASGDTDRAFSICFAISKYMFIFFYMLSLPLIIDIDYVLHLWLGKNVPDNTAAFVIILLIANTIGVLQNPMGAIIHAKGNLRFYQISGTITNLSCIVIAIIFSYIYKHQIFVFTSVLIATILNVLFAIISVWKEVDFNYHQYMRTVIYPAALTIALSLPFALIPKLMMEDGFFRLFIDVILSTTTIITVLYFIVMNHNEKEFVKEIINRKLKLKLKMK